MAGQLGLGTGGEEQKEKNRFRHLQILLLWTLLSSVHGQNSLMSIFKKFIPLPAR